MARSHRPVAQPPHRPRGFSPRSVRPSCEAPGPPPGSQGRSPAPLEFGCCALQVALLSHLNAAFNVQFTRFKTDPVQLDLVTGVVRVRLGGFLVVDERGVVILNGLRFLTLVVIALALRAPHAHHSETNTTE